MHLLNKNKKLIACFLLLFLFLPFLLLTISPFAYSASLNQNQNSWLKAILLLVASYAFNHFTETTVVTETSELNINYPHPATVNEILGFYVNWQSPEADSFQSLQNYLDKIDLVSPYWYTVTSEGELISRFGGQQEHVMTLTKKDNIKIIPLINNSKENNLMLTDPNIRTKAVNNIVNLIARNNYDGVNIDYEYIPPETRDDFTDFIDQLSTKLRSKDKLITISVFPKINVPYELHGAYDYAALAPLIDRMVIMTYDHHYRTGPPGPIAPINWVEKNINYTLQYIPQEKLLLGIANYGYNWPSKGEAQDLGAQRAYSIANEKGVDIKWLEESKTPYFHYFNEQGQKHTIHFESSYSLAFKLNLVNKYNLQGIAIWRLGNETKRFWQIVQEYSL